MTVNPTRFLIPALLCAALSSSALAAPDGTVMELDLMRQGDQIVAVVTLDHLMGLPLELDLTYEVNGQVVKNEPVDVYGQTAYVEPLGPPDQFYSVCASIDGLIRIQGDSTRPTDGMRCDLHFPSSTASPLLGSLSSRSSELRAPDARRAIERGERQGRSISTLDRR